jgi:hypothetical protein
MEPSGLSYRDRAILRAIAGGTAQLVVSSEPDLFVDGRSCSDQVAVRRLAHAGLIGPAVPGRPGQRVPAELTPAGRHELLLAG